MFQKAWRSCNTPGFLAGVLPAAVAWAATVVSILAYSK